MLSRIMRRVFRGLILMTAVIAVVVAALVAWLTTSLPQWDGRIITGVGHPTEIVRDAVGGTRIVAGSQNDAYFALGFAHAQDRLWQMDTYRRIGAGRMAEVIGKPGLTVDRFTRTLGLYRSAERQFAALPQDVRQAIVAYSAGVNGYLDQHSGPWPPEFMVLGYRPEPWQPADSLVLGKLLALMLGGNWFEELRRAALLERLTPDEVEFLMPTGLTDGPISLSGAAPLPVAAARLLAAVPAIIRPRRASNAWAVDGRHTASGKPILASDPHLGLTAPGIWYLASVSAPGLTMTGGTVPGMPIHLLGHNGHIAWGLTTTYGDLTDLLVLDVDGGDATRYRDGETVRSFEVREERIGVRFGQDQVLIVRDTRFGPVISDILDSAASHAGPGTVVVLQAVALSDADQTPASLYAVNRATDWASFRAALRAYGAPQQNFLYADTAGTIGFIAPALVPIRQSGRGLVPNRTPAGDWTGFVPFEELPRQQGSADGVISNANNRIVGPAYPHFISADWEPPFRAQRLTDLLHGAPGKTPAAHAAFQADTLSTMAQTLLPVMRARVGGTPLSAAAAAALDALATWDYRMVQDNAAPLIFAAWYAEMTEIIFGDDLGDQDGRVDPRQVYAVLAADLTPWCNHRRTVEIETCTVATTAALETAVATLTVRYGETMDDWRWGDAHPARFIHPLLSFLPGVPRWLGITVPSSGGNYTLMRGGYTAVQGRFNNGHGAGYRAVYDLGDLDQSLFMVAPGPSGNPYSRFFAAYTDAWRSGGVFQLPPPGTMRGGARAILTLVPGG
ncbi:MAG: penicillin acylase family protein [Alphaproteobacteria bacterium]|nr:penicillin acylase family protein [Alphaproteobacteria bacterium]